MLAKVSHQNFAIVHDPAGPRELEGSVGLAGAVVAIGNFDGVHRGHKAVIARAKALAGRLGRPAAALTFEPHPADFFAGRSVIFRLTPERAKALTLARLGLDGMIVLTFDAGLAGLSAERFVADILVARLGVSGVVIGYDFHFGKGRQGSPAFLVEAGRRYGFVVEVVEKVTRDEAGDLLTFNSTATREALEKGDVAAARRLLGHPYFIVGDVIHGAELGRDSRLSDGEHPARSVLPAALRRLCRASQCRWPHLRRRRQLRPPPDLRQRRGPAGDFRLRFFRRSLRQDDRSRVRRLDQAEEKFASVEALVAEIKRDVERARVLLAETAP